MFSLSGKIISPSIKHASSMSHFPDLSNPLLAVKSFVSDARDMMLRETPVSLLENFLELHNKDVMEAYGMDSDFWENYKALMKTVEITPLIGLLNPEHLYFSMIFGVDFVLVLETKSKELNYVNSGALTQVLKAKTIEDTNEIPDNSNVVDAFMKVGSSLDSLILTLAHLPSKVTVYSKLKKTIKDKHKPSYMREAMDVLEIHNFFLSDLQSKVESYSRINLKYFEKTTNPVQSLIRARSMKRNAYRIKNLEIKSEKKLKVDILDYLEVMKSIGMKKEETLVTEPVSTELRLKRAKSVMNKKRRILLKKVLEKKKKRVRRKEMDLPSFMKKAILFDTRKLQQARKKERNRDTGR